MLRELHSVYYMQVHFIRISTNRKVGNIPVTTSSADTCPDSCPLKGAGCYADVGPLAIHWRKVTKGERGGNWNEFLSFVRSLPFRQLWRHNQAGDLPGKGETIDKEKLASLVEANRNRRGFTYTHKPMTPGNLRAVVEANKNGFAVNLSANNVSHADKLSGKGAPVVTILPIEAQNGPRKFNSLAGNTVVVCPATYSNLTCERCGICAHAARKTIVGFPAHGTRKAKASQIAKG